MHWSRPARAPGALCCAPTGDEVNIDAAIVGIGCSKFGRGLPDSQLRLAAVAFKDALADAGLQRRDVDGLSIHLGWPLGVDYDRIVEGLGSGAGEATAWIQGGTHRARWSAARQHVGRPRKPMSQDRTRFAKCRQLRGAAGASQIANAAALQWGTAWGDSFILAA